MSKVLITESNLQDIASAIRSKNEGSDVYRPGDMAAAILAIPTGGGSSTLVSKTITQNGEYDPEDDNADGYSDVTVNVPNSYAAEDEGKVVSSGELVAQTSTTVTQNGTYNTTENNEVVVNVSGGGSSGGGVDEAEMYAISFTPGSNANSAKSAGWQFNTGSNNLIIKGVRFFARDAICSVYISDTNGNTIATKSDVAVTENQWNDVLFDTPVTLDKNTSYVVWGSNQTTAMKYRSGQLASNIVTIEQHKYSTLNNTFPSSTEGGSALYGIDLIITFWTKNAELDTLNVTANGTYNASDDNADGYSQVVVNVSGGGGGGGGGGIHTGTTPPSSALGVDGDVYIQSYQGGILSSTGGATINSGVTINAMFAVEAIVRVDATDTRYSTLFGCRNGSAGRFTARFNNSENGGLEIQKSATPTTNYASISTTFTKGGMRGSFYRLLVGIDRSNNTDDFPYPIYLFNNNDAGSVGGDYGDFSMKSFILTDENGIIAQYLIPAEDNGEACMLDLLTGTYHKNIGNGGFTYMADGGASERLLWRKSNGVWKAIKMLG